MLRTFGDQEGLCCLNELYIIEYLIWNMLRLFVQPAPFHNAADL